jgi:hypothetical protein
MGLLNAVRNLFSGEDRKLADTTKDLRVLLIASMKIVGAYGSIVEKYCGDATLSLKLPETLLPYPKETIAQAIANVQHVISNPSLHPMIEQVMTPEAAKRILSPDFRKFLNKGVAILSFFVPPLEAEIDQKKWEELLPVLDKLGPDVQAKYEHLFKGRQTLGDKKSDH